MPCVWFFMCSGVYMYIHMYIHMNMHFYLLMDGVCFWSLCEDWVFLRQPLEIKTPIRNQERREREKNPTIFIWKKLPLIDKASLLQNLLGKRGKKMLAAAYLVQMQAKFGGNMYVNGHRGVLIQNMAKSTKPPLALWKNDDNQHGPLEGFQPRYAVFYTSLSSCVWYLRQHL